MDVVPRDGPGGRGPASRGRGAEDLPGSGRVRESAMARARTAMDEAGGEAGAREGVGSRAGQATDDSRNG